MGSSCSPGRSCCGSPTAAPAPLRPGQVIFIGTDGVWEIPDAKGEAFGKERLREIIRESAAGSAADIAKVVRDRLAAFRGDSRQVDDVTFVVVKLRPG
ncbi:MAG TPA: SpoIIE family protein phosphatase [Gemmataceae bacterium]|nr:SpoIIE family protein phosphatase [Gemmataceae bacterium]